jgi:hypothetical protein
MNKRVALAASGPDRIISVIEKDGGYLDFDSTNQSFLFF